MIEVIEVDYPLPLSEPWQRATIKELCLIAHGICIDAFPDAIALKDKLLDIAEWLSSEYGDSNPIDREPELHPEIEPMLDVLGQHLVALKIATDQIAKLTGVSPEQSLAECLDVGKRHYQTMPPDELKSIAPLAVAALKKSTSPTEKQ